MLILWNFLIPPSPLYFHGIIPLPFSLTLFLQWIDGRITDGRETSSDTWSTLWAPRYLMQQTYKAALQCCWAICCNLLKYDERLSLWENSWLVCELPCLLWIIGNCVLSMWFTPVWTSDPCPIKWQWRVGFVTNTVARHQSANAMLWLHPLRIINDPNKKLKVKLKFS